MYGLSPVVSILDITMGKLSKHFDLLRLPRERATSSNGDLSIPRERVCWPYDDFRSHVS
jgi:hypothetical protein